MVAYQIHLVPALIYFQKHPSGASLKQQHTSTTLECSTPRSLELGTERSQITFKLYIIQELCMHYANTNEQWTLKFNIDVQAGSCINHLARRADVQLTRRSVHIALPRERANLEVLSLRPSGNGTRIRRQLVFQTRLSSLIR